MSIKPGDTLGGYRVLEKLGEGGMGEVYRARDTALGRDVALKVLPAMFARDPERLARLEREARLLAALNDPHVATIHGLEEADGVRALVMELVEGPTLAEKIAQDAWSRAKPADRMSGALAIAAQIARALEAAHDKGIIHRDLKPANIKFSHDGRVRVLDFGLAKALSVDGADHDLAHLPTLTAAELHGGVIVGTPAYMSPEQARGQTLDKRTDIWAFGCVLYEMLAGRTAFPGQTISDTIAAILEREPDWSALPAQTPASIRQLLRRCLEKDSHRRLHDAADARIEIDDARSGKAPGEKAPHASASARTSVLSTIALALLAALAAAAGVWMLRPAVTAPEARLEITTPPTRNASVAVSPDGLKIAFVVTAAGQPELWVRSLDAPSPRQLPGTEHATLPFWSPDNRSIAFFANASLKRIDVDGGSLQTLFAPSAVPLGGTWNRDDVILFADNPGGAIRRIPATGGAAVAVTSVAAPQQRGHSFPQFLPDGRHFVFSVSGSPEMSGIYIGELGTLEGKRLFGADAPVAYTASGHLLFVRNRTLFAQRFDPDRRQVEGEASPVDEHLTGRTILSVSPSGPIVYRSSSADSGQRLLLTVDRTGRELDRVMYPDTAAQGPSISRDGQRIAVYRFDQGNMDIWSFDIRRRTWDRLTFDPGDDIYPLWSPDDSSIVFGAVRQGGPVVLYRRHLTGAAAGTEEVVLPSTAFPMDWSADGRFLLYVTAGTRGTSDLWALPLGGDRKPFGVVTTEFNESLGQFSPDGKWVAYESDKTGRLEVYLRPFPGPGAEVRVSTDGGEQARWNPNGNEVFYIAPDDRLMAAPIHFSPDGRAAEPGAAAALFATNVGSTATLKYRQQYAVSPNGQFVMHSVVGEASASPITVILNWKGLEAGKR